MPFLFGLAQALKSTVLSSPCYTDGNDGSNLIQMSKDGLSVSMASLFSGSTRSAPLRHACVCVQGGGRVCTCTLLRSLPDLGAVKCHPDVSKKSHSKMIWQNGAERRQSSAVHSIPRGVLPCSILDISNLSAVVKTWLAWSRAWWADGSALWLCSC